jgi:tetratricopeptide (TPR) repeat protein
MTTRALGMAALLGLLAPGVDAQVGRGGDPRSQLQLEAATLESRGDLDGAEDAYRRLLALEPEASGTVYALERVLRAKGELDELRAIVRDFVVRSPRSEVMGLSLDLLAEADSLEAMVSAAERWLVDTPSPYAYRVVAGVYSRNLGHARVLDVLRRGRAAGILALSLDLGDALVASGDLDAGMEEWAVAIRDQVGTEAVVQRLRGLDGRAEDAARRLTRVLAREEDDRDEAITIAIEMRLEAEALELLRGVADDLEGRTRVAYLEAVAARARGAQLVRVAAWVYQEIGGEAEDPEDRREADRRIVQAALEAGDFEMALGAQRRLVASYSGSSDESRRAQAEAIRLEATADPGRVLASWREFRAAYPDAPELDEIGAAVAASLQSRGDMEGAIGVLEGIEGPRSTLERAYMLLASGEIEEGRQALFAGVSGLSPVEATPIIQFGSLLGRLSEGGTRALVTAGVAAHRGGGRAAASQLAAEAPRLPEADRPAVLAEAARMAERSGAVVEAASIRETLVEDHPDAPEVAEASLALARHIMASGGDRDTAIALLEDLITRRPNAAIVPEARLELERLRGNGGSRGS